MGSDSSSSRLLDLKVLCREGNLLGGWMDWCIKGWRKCGCGRRKVQVCIRHFFTYFHASELEKLACSSVHIHTSYTVLGIQIEWKIFFFLPFVWIEAQFAQHIDFRSRIWFLFLLVFLKQTLIYTLYIRELTYRYSCTYIRSRILQKKRKRKNVLLGTKMVPDTRNPF